MDLVEVEKASPCHHRPAVPDDRDKNSDNDGEGVSRGQAVCLMHEGSQECRAEGSSGAAPMILSA